MGESIADEIRLRKRANTDWSAYDDWWNQAIEISADIAAAREADLRAEVERLTQANHEAAMQSLADLGQAQEALERAVAAEAEVERLSAVLIGEFDNVRLVSFENGQFDFSGGPVRYIAEYFAQMFESGEGEYFNHMEI